jgi:hypothetical protein
MGFEPHQHFSNLESVNEFVECMALGIEEAKAALAKAKDKYTMYYNQWEVHTQLHAKPKIAQFYCNTLVQHAISTRPSST